jgi:hypothetical protein
METKKKINDVVFWTVVASCVFLGAYGVQVYERNAEQRNQQRKVTICPSLLSIGRSSRDTLIVMKNEPLCNQFVLDSLK